jgi:CO/xanthine dehydrogenase FAD-binding subunit
MRLARVNHLVDINGARELDYVREEEGGLAIGGLTRHRTLEHSQQIATRFPLLGEAMPQIGDRQVRFRGTLGGSLAHADPAAELPVVVVALNAEIEIASRTGARHTTAEEFFVSFFTTDLAEDELVTGVRLPPLPSGAGCAFVEFARQVGAYPIVSAAAVVTLDNGHISEARLVLGGVAGTPVRARAAEDALRGERPTADALAHAAQLAAEASDPGSDVHASAEYRRDMAAVYGRRALEMAAQRAASGRP